MSKQEAERFFAELAADEDLRNHYWTSVERATVAATLELAASRGFEFDVDELRAELESRNAELSDEELEALAGGAQPTFSGRTSRQAPPQARFLNALADRTRGRQ